MLGGGTRFGKGCGAGTAAMLGGGGNGCGAGTAAIPGGGGGNGCGAGTEALAVQTAATSEAATTNFKIFTERAFMIWTFLAY